MAQKVTVELLDDIEGNKAAETVQFALDGKTYEIDLNSRNAGNLRKSLAKYVEHGRKVSTTKSPVRRTQLSNTKHIREWARSQGMQVSDRGAIPTDVRAAYEAAH